MKPANSKAKAPPTPVDVGAYSVKQFCAAHHFSIPFFYKLVAQGRAPKLMRVGARVLISREAAAEWRALMTGPTTAA